jgi:hypothetical protein
VAGAAEVSIPAIASAPSATRRLEVYMESSVCVLVA